MSTVGIRELAERASAVVSEVTASGRPMLVTRRGRPVAAVVPIDEEELLDYVLASAPEYVADMRTADSAIAAGERGRPMDDVFADLGDTA